MNNFEKRIVEKTTSSVFGIIIAILVILGLILLGLIFILPWIAFWLAYFGGWIAKILIGKQLVNGFALIGITLPIEKIPLLAGTLGWIGGFFKTVNTNLNKRD